MCFLSVAFHESEVKKQPAPVHIQRGSGAWMGQAQDVNRAESENVLKKHKLKVSGVSYEKHCVKGLFPLPSLPKDSEKTRF